MSYTRSDAAWRGHKPPQRAMAENQRRNTDESRLKHRNEPQTRFRIQNKAKPSPISSLTRSSLAVSLAASLLTNLANAKFHSEREKSHKSRFHSENSECLCVLAVSSLLTLSRFNVSSRNLIKNLPLRGTQF